jgi:chromosome segregation ATPase
MNSLFYKQLPIPSLYDDKMKSHMSKMNVILTEYLKIYPAAKINPDYDELQNALKKNRMYYERTSSDIFSTLSSLERSKEDANTALKKINKDLNNNKQTLGKLEQRFKEINGNSMSAEQLADDYVNEFKAKQLHNVGMFFITGVLIYTMIRS